ncbi:Alanine-tRNA ligase [Phytophthora cinnamomi]|uniref:Alanine-tRNA ligase n=1 Tax=Phytophthora cinnamomi TaxID=4785 RepID=UPI0035595855|nr:Alanine-tRNA ligase [Phytophthora cinnamomi]
MHGEDPRNPDTTLNATVADNNVLVTRSNIIIVTDQDKRGVVDFIKNLVQKDASPQDDDALATQIITVFSPRNASADLPAKMMSNIKSALRSRNKPTQLRQIIAKSTEFASNLDNHGEH